MSVGNVSHWGEVKKKTKDRSQSKAKEGPSSSSEPAASSTRGGRGRGGLEAARGSRSRGSDRARGVSRGGRVARPAPAPKTNGAVSGDIPSWDATATNAAAGGWDAAAAETDTTPLESSWEHVSAESIQSPPTEDAKPAKPDGSRSWASMFAKPKAAPPSKAPRAAPSHDAPLEPPIAVMSNPMEGAIQGLPPPVQLTETSEMPSTPPISDVASTEQTADITPSKDDLTETNLEKVPDNSGPPPSVTAASTAASTLDQRAISGTPLGIPQPTPGRPPLGGFATSAYKATGMPGRSASYQRKILEQQEAVVMPGKHAVDKAAVQFGSMGLNGTPEDVDVDSDREDAETRAQPPQHSPIAPRAALPPAPLHQQGLPQSQPHEIHTAPRQAPGLPPVTQPPTAQQQPQQSAAEAPSTQSGYPYNQFGDRYSHPSSQPEASAPPQKAYEPFGQQLQQPQHYDAFSNAANAGLSTEARQYLAEKYSSGASNVSSYYTSDDQRNNIPNSQYGSYGQQPQPTGQDAAATQQRSGSAIGSSAGGQPSQHATAQGRFAQGQDAHNSGHSTPYGSISNQQSSGQQHMSQQGQGPGQHGGYGYGGYPYGGGYYSSYNMNQVSDHPYGRERPLFDDTRRYDDHYLTQTPQYGYGGGQGYGGGPFGAAGGKGMYGQQHPGYGMSPQASHDQHSASPANAGAFGQQLPGSGRDSAATGGLGGYGGRSGSTQPSDNAHSGNQSNMPDMFGRSQSGYQGLGSSNEDTLRGYGDSSKVAGGPSPALGQSGARPGSAANPQSTLPPQDARYGQQGYGGYPSHSQYGGGPGAGGHQSGGQSHQAQGYGGYGGGGYGGNYYGGSTRGGWGANYGH